MGAIVRIGLGVEKGSGWEVVELEVGSVALSWRSDINAMGPKTETVEVDRSGVGSEATRGSAVQEMG